MATIPSLQMTQHIQLKYIFGMSTEMKNAVLFHDEDRIIYPAGFNIVLHDLNDASQHYYQGTTEYRGMSCIALSPLKRYLALGMKGERVQETMEKPAIILFDTFTQKRRKNIGLNSANLDRFNIKQWVSLAFPGQNQETKYILSLSGGGGDVVLCWWWHEKGKCLATIDIGNHHEIYEIAINPVDAFTISVIGKNFFSCYIKQESSAVREEQLSKQKQEQNEGGPSSQEAQQSTSPQPEIKLLNNNLLSNLPAEVEDKNIVCQLWLTCDSYILVCTDAGDLIICDIQGNFLRLLDTSPKVHICLKSGFIKIMSAVSYSKGFFVAINEGYVLQYHYTNIPEQEPFTLVQRIHLRSYIDQKDVEISCIALNRSEDKMIVSLNNNQIYDIKLKPYNLDHATSETEGNEISLINHNNHSGSINSMDICKRKPLIATCGSDKTIKIWDYENKQLVISWPFNEEAFCISIHPQGYCIAVGFSDKLRLMNLCIHNSQNIQKNKAYKEISPFKGCREIKFSNGGQYFAAVNSTSSNHVIQVFKFFTGENPNHLVFKGHTGRVKSIYWASDDSFLVSCGLDGMVLAWKLDQDFQHSQTIVPRIVDIHNKGVNFFGLTLTYDNKTILAVGNDRHIHQAQINEQYPVDKTEKKLLDINLSSIVFPTSNKLLFAGIQDENRSSGAIRAFSYPLTHGKFTDYQAHDEKGIEKLRITNDDRYIITAGKDGCVMLFEIKDKEARGTKLKDGYSKFAEEELITRSDLDDLKSTRDGLALQINEFSNQSAMMDLNQKDDKIRLLEALIEQNGAKRKVIYGQLNKQKEIEDGKFFQEIQSIKEVFEHEIQIMDTKYQKEVMSLVEEYENQKRLHEIENNKNNKKKTKLLAEERDQILSQEGYYEKLLEEQMQNKFVNWIDFMIPYLNSTQKERVETEIQRLQKEQSEVLKQVHDEKESEVNNLNQKNQKDEQAITDQGLKAKGDISITKKKITQQQQESQDLKDQKQEYEKQKEKLKIQNLELREKIEAQKKMIIERDKTIGDKEKVIYNQKKKAQDLEKFKFVLDHKIKELKRDIGPREDEISKMKQETNNMDQYLKELNGYNNQLGTVVDELYTTQEAMKEEIKGQRYSLAQYILDPDQLAAETERLYNKHVSNKDVKRQNVEGDIMLEYRSQKKNLEKLVNMFKRSLLKDNQIHKDDKIRIMKDNVELIREINTLRKGIKDITKAQQSNPNEKLSHSQMISPPVMGKKSFSQPQLPPISKSAVFSGSNSLQKQDQQQQLLQQQEQNQLTQELFDQKQNELINLTSEVLELDKLHQALMFEHNNLTSVAAQN